MAALPVCGEDDLPVGGMRAVCQVQCPLHRARFDLATGQVIEWANFPPGIQLLDVVQGEKPLRSFPVRVKDGQVMVTT
jgi:3-phenylpropionate/trans-cinnamate dioxygenase ferredoxin component